MIRPNHTCGQSLTFQCFHRPHPTVWVAIGALQSYNLCSKVENILQYWKYWRTVSGGTNNLLRTHAPTHNFSSDKLFGRRSCTAPGLSSRYVERTKTLVLHLSLSANPSGGRLPCIIIRPISYNQGCRDV